MQDHAYFSMPRKYNMPKLHLYMLSEIRSKRYEVASSQASIALLSLKPSG